MKYPKLVKWGFIATEFLSCLTGVAGIASYSMAVKGDKAMEKALSKYNGKQIEYVLANYQQDEKAAVEFLKNVGPYTAMIYQCHPEIAGRLKDEHNKTANDKKMVTRQGDHFIVWLDDGQRQVSLKNILSERDPETRALIVATLDPETKKVFIGLAGTNPLDLGTPPDLLNAMVALTSPIRKNAISPRAQMGVVYGERIGELLKQEYPGTPLSEYTFEVLTHSLGAEAAAALKVAIAAQGGNINITVNEEPWNAVNGLNNVAVKAGIATGLLQENTVSLMASKKVLWGFFDNKFFNICTPVGEKMQTEAKGHNAYNFIPIKIK